MRVVQLTTYPLKSPRHGGQLRCAAIRERYRQSGVDVETIAVMHEGQYRASERERNDIALPGSSKFWNLAHERFVDLQTGQCLAGDSHSFGLFAGLLGRFRPDVIQLEQPWLYPAIKRYIADRPSGSGARPRLVYSSQNIEWKLKRDERRSLASDSSAHALNIAQVEALEHEVVSQSDMVVACTLEELHELREMADGDMDDSSRLYVTAPNAIAPFESDPNRLRGLKRRHGIDRYPLFVGSAHPPNADGFWEMLAPSLSFLRPDEKIVVVGGVGHFLRNHAIYRSWSGINEPRLLVLGETERDDLVALLHGAAAILLPITTGGGSNLKTAEAIYTGNRVVATTHALRGYGEASRWPTITIADTPEKFRRTLREMLDRDEATPTAAYSDTRAAVTWERALAPLVEALRVLLNPRVR